jgi:hypothetical protein
VTGYIEDLIAQRKEGRDARELPSAPFRFRLPIPMVEEIDAAEPLLARPAAIQAVLADGLRHRKFVEDLLRSSGHTHRQLIADLIADRLKPRGADTSGEAA